MMAPTLPVPPPTALSPVAGLPENEHPGEVADAFVSLFVEQMLQAMRRASHVAGAPSLGAETFEAMLDQEVARAIARQNDLGLGDLLAPAGHDEKKRPER